MAYIIPNAALDAALVTYRSAVLDGGACGIFINNFAPTPSSVIGDFIEPGAEWPGYARQTVATWGPVHLDTQGKAVCDTLISIPGPTSGAGDIVYGWVYVDSGGALVASGIFDEGPQAGTVVGGAIVFVLSSYGLLGGVSAVVIQ